MCAYKQTSCKAFLLGYLKKMPSIKADGKGNFFSILEVVREYPTTKETTVFSEEKALYRVFANEKITLHLKQYGFKGLYLWIEGDFLNSGEIIAEKINFLYFSNLKKEKNMFSPKLSDGHFFNFIEHDNKFSYSQTIH